MLDTIIIGSGAAGLSAAVYAARARLSFEVAEKEYMGTGQIALSECVDNYLGFSQISGFELGGKFRSHAESLGVKFKQAEVSKISKRKDGLFEIDFLNDKSVLSKTVIFASGAAPRKLEVDGEQRLTGRGVSYCAVCDGMFYQNKKAAVVGGGDTALGDALLLSKIAAKVYLIHRRKEFRASKALQEKIFTAENIELILNSQVKRINGESKVSSIDVITEGKEQNIEVDGLFAAVGNIPNTKFLDGFVELDKHGFIKADESGKTSLNGFFAAGDVRTKPLRQVSTAVSDGANCVVSVENYLSEVCEV